MGTTPVTTGHNDGVSDVTTGDLAEHLDHLRAAPADVGTLDLVVRRPRHGEREVLAEGVLDVVDGLVGDNWLSRATSRAVAEGRHLDAQVTVMSARMVGLLGATDLEQGWAGAGSTSTSTSRSRSCRLALGWLSATRRSSR